MTTTVSTNFFISTNNSINTRVEMSYPITSWRADGIFNRRRHGRYHLTTGGYDNNGRQFSYFEIGDAYGKLKESPYAEMTPAEAMAACDLWLWLMMDRP